MTTTTTAQLPATEKQIAFLTKLISERDAENIEVKFAATWMQSGSFGIKDASKCIDAMLKLPKAKAPKVGPTTEKIYYTAADATKAAAQVTAPLEAKEVKVGLYDTMPHLGSGEINSGRFVLVYKNAKGYMKAKRLYKSYSTKTGWSWKGIGLYGIKSWVANGKAVPVDKDSAADLGKKYGFCMYCGHLLTTDESLTAGYGPVCASSYGLPWGN